MDVKFDIPVVILCPQLPEMSGELDKHFSAGHRSEGIFLAVLHLVGLVIGTLIIVMIVKVSPYIEV